MVRSVNRGLDVLVLLSKATMPTALPEITSRLGLPRTTAFNIVRTLARRGALEFVKDKGYRIGPLITELAQARSPSKDLITRLRPFLETIAQQTGETALLSVPSGDEIVFIDRIESPQPIRYSVQVGTRRPLYCSAHGKALLATLPEDELEKYLDRTKLAANTERTIVDRTRLVHELARIRQQGYSISDGEFISEVYSVSVALSARAGGLPLAMLSAVGPRSRVKPMRADVVASLLEAARAAGIECADLADRPG